MFFSLKKKCFWCVYFDVVQIIFKMFENVQNITKLHVVANSLVFTSNPRMNILNVNYKNKYFLLRCICV